MKVFLTWSGSVSKQVASALHEWLPLVLQSLKPYMSEKDIASGVRWGADLAQNLESAQFGVICLTRANAEKPWIQFEAGAISTALADESRVAPFLFQLGPADIPETNPLAGFQGVRADEDGAWKLIGDINALLGEEQLDDRRLQAMFAAFWPRLEQSLAAIPVDADEAEGLPDRSNRDMLVELLELSRSQQTVLRSMTTGDPSDASRRDQLIHHLVTRLARHVRDTRQAVNTADAEVASIDLEDLRLTASVLLLVTNGLVDEEGNIRRSREKMPRLREEDRALLVDLLDIGSPSAGGGKEETHAAAPASQSAD